MYEVYRGWPLTFTLRGWSYPRRGWRSPLSIKSRMSLNIVNQKNNSMTTLPGGLVPMPSSMQTNLFSTDATSRNVCSSDLKMTCDLMTATQLHSCVTSLRDYMSDTATYGLSWSLLPGGVPTVQKQSWVVTSTCHKSWRESSEGQLVNLPGHKSPTKDSATHSSSPTGTTISLQDDVVTRMGLWEGTMLRPTNVQNISAHCDVHSVNSWCVTPPSSWALDTHEPEIYEETEDNYPKDDNATRDSTQSCFQLTRDYTIEQEGFEDWSWLDDVSAAGTVGTRPYDTIVRSTTQDTYQSVANNILRPTDNLTPIHSWMKENSHSLATTQTFGQVHKSDNFEDRGSSHANSFYIQEEHLASQEISNTYSDKLRAKQKMKWWYYLSGGKVKETTTTNSLIVLENRADRLLWKHSWFSSLTEARQALQHEHIGILRAKDMNLLLAGGATISKANFLDNLVPARGETNEFRRHRNEWNIVETYGKTAKPSTTLTPGDFLYWKVPKLSGYWNRMNTSPTIPLRGMKLPPVSSASESKKLDCYHSGGSLFYQFPASIHAVRTAGITPAGGNESVTQLTTEWSPVGEFSFGVMSVASAGLCLQASGYHMESLFSSSAPTTNFTKQSTTSVSSHLLANQGLYPYCQRSYLPMTSNLVALPQSLITSR